MQKGNDVLTAMEQACYTISPAQLAGIRKIARDDPSATALLLLSVYHLVLCGFLRDATLAIGLGYKDEASITPLAVALRHFTSENIRQVVLAVRESVSNSVQYKRTEPVAKMGFSFEGVFPYPRAYDRLPLQVHLVPGDEGAMEMRILAGQDMLPAGGQEEFSRMFLYIAERLDALSLRRADGIWEQHRQVDDEYTEEMQKLAVIWMDILTIKHPGWDDNFWIVGGNSMKAGKLLNRIQQELAVRLAFRDIIEHNTIRSMAALVRSRYIFDSLGPLQNADPYGRYPLSTMQRGIYMADAMKRTGAAYNISAVLRVTGDLDEEALEYAVDELLQKHEILRTQLVMLEDGIVGQQVREGLKAKDILRDLTIGEDGEALRTARQLTTKVFDLFTRPLIEIVLIRITEGGMLLTFVVHHLICDAWSLDLILTDIQDRYRQYRDGRSKPGGKPVLQYRDYVRWETKMLADHGKNAERFWTQALTGSRSLPGLFYYHPRVDPGRSAGKNITASLEAEDVERLAALSNRLAGNLFTIVLGALNILIYKYTRHTDVLIGVPVSVRNQLSAESMVGLFVNTLPVRTRIDPDETVGQLLREIEWHVASCRDHSYYPLENIIAGMSDHGEQVSFPIVLNYQEPETTGEEMALGEGVSLRMIAPESSPVKYDLAVTVVASAHGLLITMEYDPAVMPEEMMGRFLDRYLFLLRAMGGLAERSISQVAIADEAELDQVRQWGMPQTRYANESTVSQLFAEQTLLTPEQPACVVYNGKQLSYREVAQQSDRLAAVLQNLVL